MALVGEHSTPDELLSQRGRAMYAAKRDEDGARPARHLRPVE